MFPYLFVFIVSIFSTYLAEKFIKGKSKILFLFFSVIAVLFPSLLAGFRDVGIGTDTLVYVESVWKQVVPMNSLHDLIRSYNQERFDVEFIYLLINYVASRFGHGIFNIFFLTNFIVILFIYLSAYDNRKRAPMWLIMFMFLFGFYNLSLNLVRQFIAVAISVYCVKYIEQKSWWKILLSLILLKFTHSTAIFYVVFVGIYLLSLLQYKLKPLILITISIGASVFFLFLDYILLFAVASGLLPAKYAAYESGDAILSIWSLVLYNVLLLLILVFSYVFYRRNKQIKTQLMAYSYSKFYGIIILLTALMSQYAFRLSYYFFMVCDCIFIPRALVLLKKKSKKWYYLSLFVTLFLVVFIWYIYYVRNNSAETYPYKSRILGII